MAQHDYVLGNANGATYRADGNALWEAMATLNSGATAPTTTFANMPWADTSANILKRRNNANTAWIDIMGIANGVVDEFPGIDDNAATTALTLSSGLGATFEAEVRTRNNQFFAGEIAAGGTFQDMLGLSTGDDTQVKYKTGESLDVVEGSTIRAQFLPGGIFNLSLHGAYLGAAAATNNLKYYKTTTFAPVLSDGTNADATQTVAIGRYTRVGNRVFVDINLTTSALGSISGNLRVTGLPFAATTLANYEASLTCGDAGGLNITAGNNVTGLISSGNSYVILKIWDTTAGCSFLNDGEFTADGSISLTGSYETDA